MHGGEADTNARAPRRERLVAWLAALVCLLYVAGLQDVALTASLGAAMLAPPLPASVALRDASLVITVVDEADRPLSGASARVFAVRDDRTYFVGERVTDATGRVELRGLPRGEAWVLAYAAGRERASAQVELGAGAAREARLTLRPASALDVIVVDDRDAPIEGAEVRVTTADALPHVGRAGAGGKVRFDRLGPPPYVVRASAEGHDGAQRAGVAPAAAPLKLRLEALGALEVTVVRSSGEPAMGATVLAAGSTLWPARSAVTDASGFVRIGLLRAGAFDLKAQLGDEVSRTELGVRLERGRTVPVKLVLEPGRRVRVTVTDGERAEGSRHDPPPVPGANVVLAEEGLSSFPLYGRTDDRGAVVLGPIAVVGRASVSARARGFVPRTVRLDEGASEMAVALLRGGAIVGDVVDGRGFPVGGASIEVVGSDAEGMPIAESVAMTEFREDHFAFALAGPRPLVPAGELGVMPGPIPDLPRGDAALALGAGSRGGGEPWVTRADGTFRAEPVPPGRVRVIVRHPGYVEGTSELVTLRSGGEAKVRVVLHEGGRLEGRVLEEDRTPVAGARIELSAIRGPLERVAYAADDGTFAFAAVPDAVLLLVSRSDEPGETAARVEVEIPERERKEVEIVLPKRRDTMAVRVKDDRGYPLDRVEVRAMSLDPDVGLWRTVFTDDAGDARQPGVVGLALRLELRRSKMAPRALYLPAAPATLEVVLEPGVRAAGVVTARGGRERVAGASVTMHTSSGVRRTRTDDAGAFAIDDLAPGRVRVVARADGYAQAEVVKDVRRDGDRPADLGSIELPEAGEVTGVVVDPNDEPVAGARVGLGGVPTFLPLGPLPPGVALTDREGRFSLGGLPEGEVRLEAYSAELGRGAVDGVAVRAGRTTDRVTIALAGGAPKARDPKGAGSVAVTLGERAGSAGGGKEVVVVFVAPGSEAEVAGIEPGDVLRAVSGQAVSSIERARRLLTGPLGEDVVLELRRDAGGGAPEAAGSDGGTWLVRVRRERVRR